MKSLRPSAAQLSGDLPRRARTAGQEGHDTERGEAHCRRGGNRSQPQARDRRDRGGRRRRLSSVAPGLDDTQVASVEVGIGKARTAAIFRRPSKDFEDQVRDGRMAALALPGATPLQGGIPIILDGKVIGAIGVSGNTPQEDEDIAKAGAAAAAEAIANEGTRHEEDRFSRNVRRAAICAVVALKRPLPRPRPLPVRPTPPSILRPTKASSWSKDSGATATPGSSRPISAVRGRMASRPARPVRPTITRRTPASRISTIHRGQRSRPPLSTSGAPPGASASTGTASRITIPERIGDFDPAARRPCLKPRIDDYAEIWVDGELTRALGQSGGSGDQRLECAESAGRRTQREARPEDPARRVRHQRADLESADELHLHALREGCRSIAPLPAPSPSRRAK